MKKRVFVDAEELVKQHTENYSKGYKIPTITEQEIVKPYLDKISAEIKQIVDEEQKQDEKWALGLRYAIKIIDKYGKEQE